MINSHVVDFRRRLVLGFLALALTTAGLVGGSSNASVAASDAGNASLDCSTDNARVREGHRFGSDPNDVSATKARSIERRVTNGMRTRHLSTLSVLPRVTVDVHVHVITKTDGTGGVTRAQIKRQLRVLNRGFAGATDRKAAATLFRFRVASIDYTKNDDWYDWTLPDSEENPDTDDSEAKAALHRGGLDDLNIYITGLGDGLLGYATFPTETTVVEDGVVLLNESLPGGNAEPYNLGDTATHEVGHWLGLYHTFENGCTAPGDYVPDTPYQLDDENIFFCNEADDTCPQPGRDPVHNFMSYGDDPCLDRFSRGQALRMAFTWYLFRSPRVLA
jgi:hypothetical protein